MSLSPCDALEAIQQIMSGERWTPETLEAIAEIMESAGYAISDTDNPPLPGCVAEPELVTCKCGADVDTSFRSQCDECGRTVL